MSLREEGRAFVSMCYKKAVDDGAQGKRDIEDSAWAFASLGDRYRPIPTVGIRANGVPYRCDEAESNFRAHFRGRAWQRLQRYGLLEQVPVAVASPRPFAPLRKATVDMIVDHYLWRDDAEAARISNRNALAKTTNAAMQTGLPRLRTPKRITSGPT